MAAGQVPPRARRRAAWPSTTTARSWPRTSTTCRTSAPTRRRGRSAPRPPSACSSPARTGCPHADVDDARRCSPTPPGRTAYRGPWQFEIARPRGAARHRRPPHGHRPGRAAAPQPAAPRRAAVRATPTACPTTTSSPLETFEQALEMLDYDGLPRASRPRPGRPAATSASAPAATSSRRRPAWAYYGTEGATIRIEPSGKVNVYVAGGSTGNSLETTAVQLTADALGVDIEDVQHHPGRHRAHPVRRSAPAAAAAAR